MIWRNWWNWRKREDNLAIWVNDSIFAGKNETKKPNKSMSKVIIIGCGGVGTVCAHKCAQNPDVFNEIVIASRNRAKCDAVARAIGKDNISTDQVDADDVDQLVALLERHKIIR